MTRYDVAVLGAGMSGLAVAARLQARGVVTTVLEAHSKPGDSGLVPTAGFIFDVGATTLVDFDKGGVGGRFLRDIGLPEVRGRTATGLPTPGRPTAASPCTAIRRLGTHYSTRARTSANFSGIDAMGSCEEGSRSTLSAISAIRS